MTDEMSASQEDPSSPEITTPSTSEETLDELHQQIYDRRIAYIQKAISLKARIDDERTDVRVLKARYNADGGSDAALYKRITNTNNLLSSMIKNYNLATVDHASIKHLTDVETIQKTVAEVERRLRVVEVALQGGTQHEPTEDGLEEDQAVVGVLDTDVVPEEILFTVEDGSMDMIEEADDEDGQDMPPIGLFRV